MYLDIIKEIKEKSWLWGRSYLVCCSNNKSTCNASVKTVGETGLLEQGWTKFPAAYKHADGKKIDGRRVLVDVERGRTVKGWLPRRLGKFCGNIVPTFLAFSFPCVFLNSRLRIRIQSGHWIRIRIRNSDPGGQKWPTKVEKNFKKLHVLKCWLFFFCELKASFVTWTSFMEA